VLERLGIPAGGHALWTMHRPSNVDDPGVLADLVQVAIEVSRSRPVVFPVHPRTGYQLAEGALLSRLGEAPGIILTPPLGYLDFLRLQATAAVVMTDSGGVQEETTVLGVPCLTLRHSTERPITVTEGTNRIVGTDPATILAAYRDLETTHEPRRPAGWDGMAADRIAAVLTTIAPPLRAERGLATVVPMQPDRDFAGASILRQAHHVTADAEATA
jgi:UDP-N-acetylglucosamine 2-epimerase (non-hydrolysing)